MSTDPSLASAFGLGSTGITSVVGAGGKTTTICRLAAELVADGRTVVVTTTTKFGTDQLTGPIVEIAGEVDPVARVRAVLEAEPPVVVAVHHREGTKAFGVATDVVDRLHVGGIGGHAPPDHVLVEADGSRRRALKAPERYEPVISPGTDLVVAVMGLSALGGVIADVCHRSGRVAEVVGKPVTGTVGSDDLVVLATSADGAGRGVPEGARLAVVLSQVAEDQRSTAADVAADVLVQSRDRSGPSVERVIVVPRYRPGRDPEPAVDVHTL